jgi:cyclopropane fatty-acyl-phospholipid synthase-like methyltransferase
MSESSSSEAIGSLKPELARQIAYALECSPDLLPLMPELLTDLEELGGSSSKIVELLRPLDLPRGARVLDLGCGKGAVLLALAAELGVRGVGVDAFPPFIEEAHESARQRGLDGRCTFRCDDLHDATKELGGFHVAMMLGLGLAVGEQQEIVRLLRGCVPPGGFLVVDDAFLPEGVAGTVPGYEGYADHATTLARLRAHGDVILQEHCVPGEQLEQQIQRETEKIRRRAEDLVRRRPEVAEQVRAYVRRQRREARLARDSVVDAVWLLQRGP